MSRTELGLTLPHDFSVKITGDFSQDQIENELLVNSYIPGAKLTESVAKPSFEIEHHESNKNQATFDESKITIEDHWDGKISLDLWHLIYSIARRHYISQDIFPVHAVCAGYDSYSLIVGHSGVGKSTVLFKLINDANWKLFSGNKTAVSFTPDGFTAFWGTKSMSLKKGSLEKYPRLNTTKLEYSNRVAFQLGNEHLSLLHSAPIKSIFLVNLNDGVSESNRIAMPSALHLTYPYFLDVVNADTVLCSGQSVFSGEVSFEKKEILARNLSRVLPKIPVTTLSGSVEFVTENILNSK